MNVKILVAALCCGLSFSSFAAGAKAQLMWQNVSGDWTNSAIWKTGSTYRTPEDGDSVRIESSKNKGDLSVRMTGDVTNSFNLMQFRNDLGTHVTLDGNGYTIRANEQDEDFLGTEVFHVVGFRDGAYNHWFSLEQPGSGHQTIPPYKFIDPLIETYVDDQGFETVKFSHGDYNMAGAETVDETRTLIIGGNYKAGAIHAWFAGGTFTIPTFNYKANSPTNVITISGAGTELRAPRAAIWAHGRRTSSAAWCVRTSSSPTAPS